MSNTSSYRSITKAICLLACLLFVLTSVIIPSEAFAASKGVTNAKVVLRKSASTKATALQTVYKGTEITILDEGDTWSKVRYGSFTGYMMSKYIDGVKTSSSSSSSSSSTTSSSSSGSSMQSMAAQIKALGDAPGPMLVGDSNSDVTKLQKALQILGYYKGKIDGRYGNDTANAVKAYQKSNGLEADGYAGKLTVKKLFGSCRSTSLSTQNSTATSNTTTTSSSTSTTTTTKYSTVSSISKIGAAPKVSKMGYTGSDVVKLQQALECIGYYTGVIDGDYGQQTYNAVKRYQSKNGLKADGIAGEATIRALFGKEPGTNSAVVAYKTETLDWYKDNVTKVIPKGARFTVKDVKTGKTFQMVRWSGGDHMDSEPASKEDTATIKSIYGGSFSWDRRAILILYKGHVYAASMNGMPHGTTTISNSFDGHLCIHFKNSKTHGSDKIDPDHQAAVRKASNAKW